MILIRGGHVVDPANHVDAICDILLKDGKVAGVGRDLSCPGSRVYDAAGMMVTPGFVEMHAHLRDPGDAERETMYTGTCSAAAGGFTSVAAMPNTLPAVDTPEKVRAVRRRIRESAVTNVFPMAAATMDRAGEVPVDMAALKAAGAVAFSDDGNAIASAGLMRELLLRSREVGLVIDVHCEDKAYTEGGVVNDGEIAQKMGLGGISSAGEDMMIARDLIIQEEVGGHLHIAHLGSARSVELVRFFRGRGVPFTCEVIPHQFSLTEDIVAEKGTRAKVKPPLRSQRDVDGIRLGLRDHLIDVVATDHCPYTLEEIDCAIDHTRLFGLAGFETTLPLLLDMVHRGLIDYTYAIGCLTANPARILRLSGKGALGVGCDADVTIFAPEEEWTVRLDDLKTKARNSPYEGYRARGRVHTVFVGGEPVFHGGEIRKDVAIAE